MQDLANTHTPLPPYPNGPVWPCMLYRLHSVTPTPKFLDQPLVSVAVLGYFLVLKGAPDPVARELYFQIEYCMNIIQIPHSRTL